MRTTLAAALVLAGSLAAQDVSPPSQQPLPEHAWLQQLVGEWQVRSEAKMAPGAPPMKFEFTETVRAFGELWIQSEARAEVGGQPFAAQMTLGYDPQKKAFVGTWLDTMTPHLWIYRGELDAAQKVLTLSTEGPAMDDPSRTREYRDVIRIDGKGGRWLTSHWLGDDGKWVEFQQATYTRATKTEVATFAGGCFWCIEAVLDRIEGVTDVESGYMGGHVENPTYEQICGKKTGHAEVVRFRFDPAVISYEKLLRYFFAMHDPTTLNRQGNDVGPQYRSAIFFHDEAQQKAALAVIEAVQPKFDDPIVTEVTKATTFWPAEEYHQDYWQKNPDDRYCNAFIPGKLEKLGLEK